MSEQTEEFEIRFDNLPVRQAGKTPAIFEGSWRRYHRMSAFH